jgi:hypothetical protein
VAIAPCLVTPQSRHAGTAIRFRTRWVLATWLVGGDPDSDQSDTAGPDETGLVWVVQLDVGWEGERGAHPRPAESYALPGAV